MELELIEPVLYFRMDADSPMLFAHALTTRLCCWENSRTISVSRAQPNWCIFKWELCI